KRDVRIRDALRQDTENRVGPRTPQLHASLASADEQAFDLIGDLARTLETFWSDPLRCFEAQLLGYNRRLGPRKRVDAVSDDEVDAMLGVERVLQVDDR